MANTISIFDTTLRDGTQGEGISLSADDKLKIAQKLDALGVHYIEGGNPGSNSKDIEFFQRVKGLNLNAKVTAFGSTRRKNSIADQDSSLDSYRGIRRSCSNACREVMGLSRSHRTPNDT